MQTFSFKKIISLITYTVFLLLICFNLSKIVQVLSIFSEILSPFFIAIVIAFIVNQPVKRIEKGINKKFKFKRILSVLLAYLLIIVLVLAISMFLVPEIINSIKMLFETLPTYFENLQIYVQNLSKKYNFNQNIIDFMNLNLSNIFQFSYDFLVGFLPKLLDLSVTFAKQTTKLFIAFVLSFYFLFNKEAISNELKRIFRAILNKNHYNYLIYVCESANTIFSSFVTGVVIEALVLGGLCTVGLLLLRIDFAILIGVLVAITSFIPIIGAFISAIPAFLILFSAEPKQALIFLVFILILQQIEGDLIYPRIVGKSLNISGLYILIAVIIGGSLFGILGLFLSVPTFALLYKLFNERIEKISKKNGNR